MELTHWLMLAIPFAWVAGIGMGWRAANSYRGMQAGAARELNAIDAERVQQGRQQRRKGTA